MSQKGRKWIEWILFLAIYTAIYTAIISVSNRLTNLIVPNPLPADGEIPTGEAVTEFNHRWNVHGWIGSLMPFAVFGVVLVIRWAVNKALRWRHCRASSQK